MIISRASFTSRVVQAVNRFAWIFLLVSLPVTSFPYFPKAFGGSALVRPLGMYPLLVLVVLFTLPRLFTRPVPGALRSLIPFVLVAVGASLISMLRGIDPVFGVSVADRVLRAVMTLAIGAAIYYTVALFPTSPDDLRGALRWLYAGFSIALLWGSLQAIYVVRFDPDYYKLLSSLQDFISTRKLFTTRISGMTYEPNWFAVQISSLLLPWLFASILSGYSVFRWRWRFLTIEWLLAAWGIVVLAFTFSRAGIANLFVLAFLAFLFFRPARSAARGNRSILRSLPRRVLETAVVVAILGGVIYVAGSRNSFFSRMWDYWSQANQRTLSEYFEYVGFGARFTYGEAAFRTYETNPMLGVGLGNYAFYFPKMLPDQPLAATPELLRIILPDDGRDRLITPKNFYFRILAETGLLGAAAFLAFLAAILGCSLYLWLSPELEEKYWGSAGLLGLIAFLTSSLSFDSFAIPNMWVVFGLTTAAAWTFSRRGDKNLQGEK
jgi:hypothetical protein